MFLPYPLLGGLRVHSKVLTGFCPWLFTWSDYEEDYEDDEEFNDGYAN
jgi:hypothetical protein